MSVFCDWRNCVNMTKRKLSVFITVMACLIDRRCADSVDVMRVDEGHNFTVLWKLPKDLHGIYFIGLIQDSGRNDFACMYGLDCYRRTQGSRTGLLTQPPLRPDSDYLGPLPHETNITDLGLFFTKVEPSDAGLYIFRADTFPDRLSNEFILYVHRKPTKPVLTITEQIDVITITCTSSIQSVPEQYRNTSELEYIWIVNSSLDNYDLDDNQIRITNAQQGVANTASFSCTAREWNSTLVSEASDILALYIRNITLDIWLSFDDPHRVNLICNADCKPACSYQWLNEEGKSISTTNSLLLEEVDDIRFPTCVAINGLGSLSKRADKLLEVSGRTKQDIVLYLSVCLALALAVAVITGSLLIIFLRRQRNGDHQTDGSRPAVSKTEPSVLYENRAISHDTDDNTTTYEQLSRSPPPRPQPSSYEVISVTNTTGRASGEESMYEAV